MFDTIIQLRLHLLVEYSAFSKGNVHATRVKTSKHLRIIASVMQWNIQCETNFTSWSQLSSKRCTIIPSGIPYRCGNLIRKQGNMSLIHLACAMDPSCPFFIIRWQNQMQSDEEVLYVTVGGSVPVFHLKMVMKESKSIIH